MTPASRWRRSSPMTKAGLVTTATGVRTLEEAPEGASSSKPGTHPGAADAAVGPATSPATARTAAMLLHMGRPYRIACVRVKRARGRVLQAGRSEGILDPWPW